MIITEFKVGDWIDVSGLTQMQKKALATVMKREGVGEEAINYSELSDHVWVICDDYEKLTIDGVISSKSRWCKRELLPEQAVFVGAPDWATKVSRLSSNLFYVNEDGTTWSLIDSPQESHVFEAGGSFEGALFTRPKASPKAAPKTPAQHQAEMLCSFYSSIAKAGGDVRMFDMQTTLGDIVRVLAQNGVRFTLEKLEKPEATDD